MSIPADLSSECGGSLWDMGGCDSFFEIPNDSINILEVAVNSSNQPSELHESSSSNSIIVSKDNSICLDDAVCLDNVVENILDISTSICATEQINSPGTESADLSDQKRLSKSKSKDRDAVHRSGGRVTGEPNQGVNNRSYETDSGYVNMRQLSSRSCIGKKFKYVPGVTEEAAKLYSMRSTAKSWPELEEEGECSYSCSDSCSDSYSCSCSDSDSDSAVCSLHSI
jgi:hypothetical protein